MREATELERKSTQDYIDSISYYCLKIPITKNATNGDIIKALFPDIKVCGSTMSNKVYTEIPLHGTDLVGASIYCMEEWLKAPYSVQEVKPNEFF